MLKRTYEGQSCSVAGALEVVGERWTLLIVRDALLGVTRFDGFLASLGLARNVLAVRLNGLVDNGVLERVPYQVRPLRHEYHITPKGRALAPVVISLMEWGDRFTGQDCATPPREARHHDCGGLVTVRLGCAECGQDVPEDEIGVVATTGGDRSGRTTQPGRTPPAGAANSVAGQAGRQRRHAAPATGGAVR